MIQLIPPSALKVHMLFKLFIFFFLMIDVVSGSDTRSQHAGLDSWCHGFW